MTKRRWKYPKRDETFEALKKETGVDDLALQILVNRGITDPGEIDRFLNSNIHHLHDTRLMQDAVKGAQVIKEAVENGDEIVIYGDYDDDGALASVIGVKALRHLGATASHYTNDRFEQGYGMQVSGVDEILETRPNTKLIITVDNGIMAFEAAEYAVKEKGLKLVITDHHEQGSELPMADAVIDPKRKDDTYPCKYLCGAGVIWKLMLLLYWEMGQDLKPLYAMLDIVAMATVGDIVPLLDENRILVKEGLERMRNGDSLVFRVLQEVTKVAEINSHYTLGFVYVPMVNAVGRLHGNVDIAIEMFLSEDEDRVREIAISLKNLNDDRKELTVTQEELGEGLLEEKGLKEVIIVAHETFHEGIVGLVSGRLKERYNRPAIVLKREEDGTLKGSARSIPGMHLKEAFDECADLLVGYGGHEMAAGLSLKEENLDAFEARMLQIAKRVFTEDSFVKVYEVDYRLQPKDLTFDVIDTLKELEPYGAGFQKPILSMENFDVRKVSYMGSENQHLKLLGENNLSLLVWREADKYIERKEPKRVKAIGYPEINVWNNNVNVQFTVDNDNFIAC